MLRKHSITIRGHATSVSLEDAFWESLEIMARDRQETVAALVTQIDDTRKPDTNLSSALRLAVLQFWKLRANSS